MSEELFCWTACQGAIEYLIPCHVMTALSSYYMGDSWLVYMQALNNSFLVKEIVQYFQRVSAC